MSNQYFKISGDPKIYFCDQASKKTTIPPHSSAWKCPCANTGFCCLSGTVTIVREDDIKSEAE